MAWLQKIAALAQVSGGPIKGTPSYTGNSFNISATATSIQGMATDGIHIYALVFEGIVYRFNLDWSYTGFSFSTAGQATSPRGITFDGVNLWVIFQSNQRVYSYNPTTGVNSGGGNLVSQDPLPYDISWDGVYFYVCGSQQTVRRYSSSWALQPFSFVTSGQTAASADGLDWDGASHWVSSIGNDIFTGYDDLGVSTGTTVDVTAQGNDVPQAIMFSPDKSVLYCAQSTIGIIDEYK